MTEQFIDVWDAGTFDEELLEILSGQSDLIQGYVTTANEITVLLLGCHYDLGVTSSGCCNEVDPAIDQKKLKMLPSHRQ